MDNIEFKLTLIFSGKLMDKLLRNVFQLGISTK